ncbi:unnamed protein product, partial [Amoebophrya sp. A25]
ASAIRHRQESHHLHLRSRWVNKSQGQAILEELLLNKVELEMVLQLMQGGGKTSTKMNSPIVLLPVPVLLLVFSAAILIREVPKRKNSMPRVQLGAAKKDTIVFS